ncbi:MAG: site specific recombinase, partial [uncultured bacterium (gcode 4)]
LMNTTKTGVAREYPVTEFFQGILDQLPKNNSNLVFVRSKDGKRYTSKDINAIWHKACEAAGVLPFKLYNGVRHSKARNLLENGESFDMVAEVLGHASVDMTRRFYADMPMNRIKEALQNVRNRKRE